MVHVGNRFEATGLMAIENDRESGSPTAWLLFGVAKQGMDAFLRSPRHDFPPR